MTVSVSKILFVRIGRFYTDGRLNEIYMYKETGFGEIMQKVFPHLNPFQLLLPHPLTPLQNNASPLTPLHQSMERGQEFSQPFFLL
jgi:hypothetical protein